MKGLPGAPQRPHGGGEAGVDREATETGGERVSSTVRLLRRNGKIGDAEVATAHWFNDTE
jgi:hypothetical protein